MASNGQPTGRGGHSADRTSGGPAGDGRTIKMLVGDIDGALAGHDVMLNKILEQLQGLVDRGLPPASPNDPDGPRTLGRYDDSQLRGVLGDDGWIIAVAALGVDLGASTPDDRDVQRAVANTGVTPDDVERRLHDLEVITRDHIKKLEDIEDGDKAVSRSAYNAGMARVAQLETDVAQCGTDMGDLRNEVAAVRNEGVTHQQETEQAFAHVQDELQLHRNAITSLWNRSTGNASFAEVVGIAIVGAAGFIAGYVSGGFGNGVVGLGIGVAIATFVTMLFSAVQNSGFGSPPRLQPHTRRLSPEVETRRRLSSRWSRTRLDRPPRAIPPVRRFRLLVTPAPDRRQRAAPR